VPEPDCREVFTVSEVVAATAEPAPPVPRPSSAPTTAVHSGRLTDFVPILEVESASHAPVLEIERIDPEPFRFVPEPAPVRVIPPPQPAKLLPPFAPAKVVPPDAGPGRGR